MKKTIIFMIIFVGLLTNLLLSQGKQVNENKITYEDIRKESITLQQIYFENKKEKKITVLVRADYFLPTEQLYKDVYGSGIHIGGEVTYSIWKAISIYFGASLFSKKGAMIPFEEETTISIIPIELGALYSFSTDKIKPYIGGGVGYYSLSEESFLGKVTGGGVGFFGQLGVGINLINSIVIDISAKYNFSNVTIGAVENNIGGIRIGMGIGASF